MSEDMTFLQWLEGLSYVVTIVGLPFAIWIFLVDQRKERVNDDEEVYLKLSDDYEKFLKLVLDNSDLQLVTNKENSVQLSPEQIERRDVLFEILISLFERAYILVYEDNLKGQPARLWLTWEDYMRSWCSREDFRSEMPKLLEGEDPDFQEYIKKLARKVEDDKKTASRK
jgi:hypothetical protein